MTRKEYADEWIKKQCSFDEGFARNIELLDQYDFSEFITEGRNLWNLREEIENNYDKEFWNKYHMYVFDYLDGEDTCYYFTSRYNVHFQEYIDWVIRHDNGTDEKTERRA